MTKRVSDKLLLLPHWFTEKSWSSDSSHPSWCHVFLFTRCLLTSGGFSPNCGFDLCDPVGLCGSEQNKSQSLSQTINDGLDQHWSQGEDSIIAPQAAATEIDDLYEVWKQDGTHVQHLYVFMMLKCAVSRTFSALLDDKMYCKGFVRLSINTSDSVAAKSSFLSSEQNLLILTYMYYFSTVSWNFL